jgi:hypothetical protein
MVLTNILVPLWCCSLGKGLFSGLDYLFMSMVLANILAPPPPLVLCIGEKFIQWSRLSSNVYGFSKYFGTTAPFGTVHKGKVHSVV